MTCRLSLEKEQINCSSIRGTEKLERAHPDFVINASTDIAPSRDNGIIVVAS